jgi:hypothetical protein
VIRCDAWLWLLFADLLKKRREKRFVNPVPGREQGVKQRLCAIKQTTPLRFNENPEASKHGDPASGSHIPSTLLIDEEWRMQFLGEDHRFPLAGVEDVRQVGHHRVISHDASLDPFPAYDLSGARPFLSVAR